MIHHKIEALTSMMIKGAIMTTIDSSSESRVRFTEDIELVEFCLSVGHVEVADAITIATGWKSAEIAILSRSKNLMGTCTDAIRVRNAALSNFDQATIAKEHFETEYTDMLIEIPGTKVRTLAVFRQRHWVVATPDRGTLRSRFVSLRAAFDHTDLKLEVRTLLASCGASARIWTGGSDRILQVFHQANSPQ